MRCGYLFHGKQSCPNSAVHAVILPVGADEIVVWACDPHAAAIKAAQWADGKRREVAT